MNYNLLKAIDVTSLITVVIIVAVLAIVFGVLIIIVSKACAVKENEDAKKISELLSGANCGGCGFAGCADFAKALVEGRATLNSCASTPKENREEIAKILGVDVEDLGERFAVVKCSGGNYSKNKYKYVGNSGCISQCLIMGGRKICSQGCLGEGSCEEACPYGAIKIVEGVSYVDKNLCEACGACTHACPKSLIELIPKSAKVFIACSSHCRGKEVMNACEKGCIGCGMCAKKCPEGAITMENNLPVIDYAKCSACKTCVSACPRKCIKEI